jgi:MFS transporter, SP family, solute carrier family 2 (myo-inositol transporter), member 13
MSSSVDEKHLDSESKASPVETTDEQVGAIFQKNRDGEISELVVVAEGEERTTLFVWLLIFCSSISGLLFGEFSTTYRITRALDSYTKYAWT